MSSTGGMSGQQPSDKQLKGGWLIFVRLAWLVIAGIGVGLNILGLPREFAQLVTVCNGVSCDTLQLTLQQAQSLQQAGLSVEFYAIYATVAAILPQVVYLLGGLGLFFNPAAQSGSTTSAVATMILGTGETIQPEYLSLWLRQPMEGV